MTERRGLGCFPGCGWMAIAVFLATMTLRPEALVGQPASGKSAVPNFAVGAKEYPDADAIILRWEQSWTMQKDGTVSYRDHRWVKLLNSRALGAFADPRIDYCVGQDELRIHVAQTTLPDGRVIPVPPYAFNVAGPDDVSGWVEYKDWQQKVVSFSGIEDGCVVELDYEIVTRPGILPWLEAEVRLHDDYPVVERVVTVAVPAGTPYRAKVFNAPSGQDVSEEREEQGLRVRSYLLRNLAASRGEAQSLPWPRRDARLAFTTCGGPEDLVKTCLQRVEDAAKAAEGIRQFAEKVVEKETAPRERVRKLAAKLADSFTVIGSPKALRSLTCRPAEEVLRANYGHPLEAAAVLTGALRAIGLKVVPMLAVEADLWSEEAPVRSALWAVVLSVETPDGAVLVHPQHGLLRNPGPHGRKWLLALAEDGRLSRTYLATRSEKTTSELNLHARLAMSADGKISGDLRIALTGGFYDPAGLETAAQQESLIRSMAGRVAVGVDLGGQAITELSSDRMVATAKLAAKSPLKMIGQNYALQLGDGPAFLAEFPLPLGVATRRSDVSLPGPLSEQVEVTVELPDGWKPLITPRSVKAVQGPWGEAVQTVEVSGKAVRLSRRVLITTDRVPVEAWPSLREAVNDLKADAARMLLAGPETQHGMTSGAGDAG